MTNKSGHKNISWHKGSNTWNVQIYVKRKKVVDKYFSTLEDAIIHRDKMLPLVHGEYFSL